MGCYLLVRVRSVNTGPKLTAITDSPRMAHVILIRIVEVRYNGDLGPRKSNQSQLRGSPCSTIIVIRYLIVTNGPPNRK